MHVTSKRPSLAAALLIALTGIVGVTYAAGFDEKIRAPVMKTTADFKTQVQSFAKKYADIRAAAPAQLVTDASLARQQFDLIWQVQHAIDLGKPIDELAEVGVVSSGNGEYAVDMGGYPQWNELAHVFIAVTLPDNLEHTSIGLIQRGFRPGDLATLRKYLEEHDYSRVSTGENLAISLAFARAVRKYDERKLAVPDSLVVSYWYQRMRAQSEGERIWAEGLLRSFDAQRQRALLSIVTEIRPTAIWKAEDVAAGIAEVLTEVRLPDYEQRITSEAKGVAP